MGKVKQDKASMLINSKVNNIQYWIVRSLEAENSIEVLSTSLKQYSEELNAQKKINHKLTEMLNENTNRLRDVDAKYWSAMGNNTTLKIQLEQAEQSFDEMSEALRIEQAKVELLTNQANLSHENYTDLLHDHIDRGEAIARLEQKNKKLVERHQKLQVSFVEQCIETNQAKDSIEEKENYIARLGAALGEARADLTTVLAQKAERVRFLNEQIVTMTDQLNRASENEKELLKSFMAKDQEIAKLSEDLINCEISFESVRDALNDHIDKVEYLRGELKEAKEAWRAVQEALQLRQREIWVARDELAKSNDEADRLDKALKKEQHTSDHYYKLYKLQMLETSKANEDLKILKQRFI